MRKNDLKIGDKVLYKEAGVHGVHWFLDGSILTYLGPGGNGATGQFSGPALKDGCGGRKVKEGETFDAFAMYEDVEFAPMGVMFQRTEKVHITYQTTIVVDRDLTDEERKAVIAILEAK